MEHDREIPDEQLEEFDGRTYTHAEMLEHLSDMPDALTAWEADFVEGMLDRLEANEFYMPSDGQREVLKELYRKKVIDA